MYKKVLIGIVLFFVIAVAYSLIKSFKAKPTTYEVKVGDVFVSNLFDADLVSKAIRPTAFLVTKILENKVFIKAKGYYEIFARARSQEEANRKILDPNFFNQGIKMYIFELKDLELGKMYFYLECDHYDEDYLNPKSSCYKDPSILEPYPRLGTAVRIN